MMILYYQKYIITLGLADVKAFGIHWKDCEAIMENVGFKWKVKALAVA
jgi:hypothetical protein